MAAGLDRESLSAISEDVRTPLALILGYADLLQRPADEATRLEVAIMLRQAAERLAPVLDELLALVGVQAGAPPVPGPVDVRRAALEAGESLAPDRVRFGPEGWAPVVADGDHVRILLRALVADLLADEGASITIGAGEEEGRLAFTLAQADRDDLDDARSRRRPAAPYLARLLAEANGGSLRETTSPGGARSFLLRLPLTE